MGINRNKKHTAGWQHSQEILVASKVSKIWRSTQCTFQALCVKWTFDVFVINVSRTNDLSRLSISWCKCHLPVFYLLNNDQLSWLLIHNVTLECLKCKRILVHFDTGKILKVVISFSPRMPIIPPPSYYFSIARTVSIRVTIYPLHINDLEWITQRHWS